MMKRSAFLLACLMVLGQSDFAVAAPGKTSAGTTKRTPVRRKTGTSRYHGQTVKRNADGSIEVFDSGPSGVLPAGGGYSYSEDAPVESGNDRVKQNPDGSVEVSGSGPSGTLGPSSSSQDVPSSIPASGPMETPDGMKVIRNPDGSIEVSDSGPSGTLPGYAPVSRPRTTRRPTHQPQKKPVTAISKPATTTETKPTKTSAPKASSDEWLPPELGGTEFGTTAPKKK